MNSGPLPVVFSLLAVILSGIAYVRSFTPATVVTAPAPVPVSATPAPVSPTPAPAESAPRHVFTGAAREPVKSPEAAPAPAGAEAAPESSDFKLEPPMEQLHKLVDRLGRALNAENFTLAAFY